MSIALACVCGKSFNLKDELLGKLVQCPACGATMRVQQNVSPKPALADGIDPCFNHDKFLLRQKTIAINEKYYVWDEAGKNIMFIERPRHILRNLGAAFLAAFTFIFVMIAAGAAASVFEKSPMAGIIFIIGALIAIVAAFTVGIVCSKKRHLTIYADDTKKATLLRIGQDKKFEFLVGTFTVATPEGTPIAYLRKNYLTNIFRKKWKCFDQDRLLKFEIKEDSIILSLLRRLIGPLFGLLRTNFIICSGDKVIGEFNRKLTLLDRYVLDVSKDRARELDRRVALAIGVMLDSGERR